jgi:hypothetical protein
MARMNDHFNLGDAEICRQTVCKIRKKLRIFYGPPSRVQDMKSDQEAARMILVSLVLDWLRDGRIRNLMFCGESRFYRGAESLWAPGRPGPWNLAATITEQGIRCVWGQISRARSFSARMVSTPTKTADGAVLRKRCGQVIGSGSRTAGPGPGRVR